MANLKGKANMKDIILDVVKHTAGLGFIESVKVTGTTQETRFDAMDTDRTVILNATLHNPNPDLIGEFGMGNLFIVNKHVGVGQDGTGRWQLSSRVGFFSSVEKSM